MDELTLNWLAKQLQAEQGYGKSQAYVRARMILKEIERHKMIERRQLWVDLQHERDNQIVHIVT